MSTGNLRYERKTDAELYKILGEGDTPKLYARHIELDTSCHIAYCGGNSTDGKRVYIDRQFYLDLKAGKIAVKGISWSDIVQAIVEHEHTEWSIDTGDNPVDSYPASHEYATTKELRFVRQAGGDADRYQEILRSPLEECLRRFIALGTKTKVPRDLWCGPYLDDPDEDDKKILRILRAKGVTDAFKVSKISVHYGIGEEECRDCSMFYGKTLGDVRPCELVSGLVRANRHCDKWQAKDKQNG